MKPLSLLLVLLMLASACAEAPASGGRVLLLVASQDPAATDVLRFGCLDDRGILWCMEVTGERALSADQPIEWLADIAAALAEGRMDLQGEIGEDVLNAAQSLVDALEGASWKEEASYQEAGQLYATAFRYGEAGAEAFPLALAGIVCAEDTDANAQALFQLSISLFPSLAESVVNAGALPEGFAPVPLLQFCGFDGQLPEDATATLLAWTDGAWETLDVDEEKLDTFLSNADEMAVIGKQSAIIPQEDVVWLRIMDRTGESLVEMYMYQGLLVAADGVYRIGVQVDAGED